VNRDHHQAGANTCCLLTSVQNNVGGVLAMYVRMHWPIQDIWLLNICDALGCQGQDSRSDRSRAYAQFSQAGFEAGNSLEFNTATISASFPGIQLVSHW